MINPSEQIEMRLRPHGVLILVNILAWVGGIAIITGLESSLRGTAFGSDHRAAVTLGAWTFGLLITVAVMRLIWRILSSKAYISHAHVYVTEGMFGITRAWGIARDEIEQIVTRYGSRLAHLFDIGTVELHAGDQTLVLRGLHHPQMLVDELKVVPEVFAELPEAAPVAVIDIPEPHVAETPALVTSELVPEVIKQTDSWALPGAMAHQSQVEGSANSVEMVEGEAVYF